MEHGMVLRLLTGLLSLMALVDNVNAQNCAAPRNPAEAMQCASSLLQQGVTGMSKQGAQANPTRNGQPAASNQNPAPKDTSDFRSVFPALKGKHDDFSGAGCTFSFRADYNKKDSPTIILVDWATNQIVMNVGDKDVVAPVVQNSNKKKVTYTAKLPDGRSLTINSGRTLKSAYETDISEYKIVRTELNGSTSTADLVGVCGV